MTARLDDVNGYDVLPPDINTELSKGFIYGSGENGSYSLWMREHEPLELVLLSRLEKLSVDGVADLDPIPSWFMEKYAVLGDLGRLQELQSRWPNISDVPGGIIRRQQQMMTPQKDVKISQEEKKALNALIAQLAGPAKAV
jgi:hypothetical protein